MLICCIHHPCQIHVTMWIKELLKMKGTEDERVKYNEKKIYIMSETLDILISFIGFEFSCKSYTFYNDNKANLITVRR